MRSCAADASASMYSTSTASSAPRSGSRRRTLIADSRGWRSRRSAVGAATISDAASRAGKPRDRVLPDCDGAQLDVAAYAELLGWYLGDGRISRHGATCRRCASSCDATLRRGDHRATSSSRCAASSRRGTMPPRPDKPGCVVITVGLEALAVPVPAARPRAQARAPDRARATGSRTIVEAFPAAFLRGLFHSDGCRVNNWATRDGRRREEALRLPALAVHQQLRRTSASSAAGRSISSTSRGGSPTAKTISVSRREGVARLDELIGLKQ